MADRKRISTENSRETAYSAVSLRRRALRARRALSDEERRHFSEQIVGRILPYLQDADGIGLYLALADEVDVGMLLRAYLKTKRIAVPVMEEDGVMHFAQVVETTRFHPAAYGVLEPQDAVSVEPHDLDVIVVPLVAFDAACHRIGHGLGYYDRYLHHFTGRKIGVAFSCQQVEKIQPRPHDVCLDMVISEQAVYAAKPVF